MSASQKSNSHPLLAFFVLAFTFSWLVELPLALYARGILSIQIPEALHYLAGYGPLLSALVVTGWREGSRGIMDLIRRMTHWKVPVQWWLMAVSPFALYLLVGAGLQVIRGLPFDISAVGQVDFLPPLGLAALPLWVLTFGIGEETGWRGYALPRLQKGRSALSATLILWVMWGLWHLPMFFYTYSPSVVPGMLVGLLAGAILFTWLYNSTGGSVLICAVWHGLFNAVTACAPCESGWAAPVVSTAVMAGGLLIVVAFKPAAMFPRKKRNTVSPARRAS